MSGNFFFKNYLPDRIVLNKNMWERSILNFCQKTEYTEFVISFEDSPEATLQTEFIFMQPAKLWELLKRVRMELLRPCDCQQIWSLHRPEGCLARKHPTVRDRHKCFQGSLSTHQSVCIHEDTFAVMSKSPAMELSEGYTQFWPLHQSQVDWVSAVKHTHLDHLIKYAAEDWPTREQWGERRGFRQVQQSSLQAWQQWHTAWH